MIDDLVSGRLSRAEASLWAVNADDAMEGSTDDVAVDAVDLLMVIDAVQVTEEGELVPMDDFGELLDLRRRLAE